TMVRLPAKRVLISAENSLARHNWHQPGLPGCRHCIMASLKFQGRCDILIVGGGTGGCAAALAATSLGYRVIMTEPTAWVGGRLTSQAVPPDENLWIDQFGCTRRYRAFREGVRRYYRDHYPLSAAARGNPRLNPGGGYV